RRHLPASRCEGDRASHGWAAPTSAAGHRVRQRRAVAAPHPHGGPHAERQRLRAGSATPAPRAIRPQAPRPPSLTPTPRAFSGACRLRAARPPALSGGTAFRTTTGTPSLRRTGLTGCLSQEFTSLLTSLNSLRCPRWKKTRWDRGET